MEGFRLFLADLGVLVRVAPVTLYFLGAFVTGATQFIIIAEMGKLSGYRAKVPSLALILLMTCCWPIGIPVLVFFTFVRAASGLLRSLFGPRLRDDGTVRVPREDLRQLLSMLRQEGETARQLVVVGKALQLALEKGLAQEAQREVRTLLETIERRLDELKEGSDKSPSSEKPASA